MIEIIGEILGWLVSKLPGFTIRLFYRPDRLRSRIEIDLRPRGESLTFDRGEAPYVSLWLTIRNGTPFPIDLDRMRVDLWCQGYRLGDLFFLDRTTIPKGASKDILIRGLSGARYGESLAEKNGRCVCSVHVRAEFESKVGRVIYETRQLEGIKPTLSNVSSSSLPAASIKQ